jgi:hypothetical protein
MPDLNPELFTGDPTTSPLFAKAPSFLQDSLMFPYTGGVRFTQEFLRASQGWGDLHKLFEKPPVSTQQILHPALYLNSSAAKPVTLPDLKTIVPQDWKKLDENVIGEFGLQAIFKQFLGKDRAPKLAQYWAGDRYAIFEQPSTKDLLLIARLHFRASEDAGQFFDGYSEVLERKYPSRRQLLRRANYLSFGSGDGDVFLSCSAEECVTVEGGAEDVFRKLTRALGWAVVSEPPAPAKAAPRKTAWQPADAVPRIPQDSHHRIYSRISADR